MKNETLTVLIKRREREKKLPKHIVRRTKEIIEGRKIEAEEGWTENTAKQGRTQQRRKGEEKTRKIWRKEREISAKKASKRTVYVLCLFFYFLCNDKFSLDCLCYLQ